MIDVNGEKKFLYKFKKIYIFFFFFFFFFGGGGGLGGESGVGFVASG